MNLNIVGIPVLRSKLTHIKLKWVPIGLAVVHLNVTKHFKLKNLSSFIRPNT